MRCYFPGEAHLPPLQMTRCKLPATFKADRTVGLSRTRNGPGRVGMHRDESLIVRTRKRAVIVQPRP